MNWKSTEISKTDLEKLKAGKIEQENKKNKKKASPKRSGNSKKSKSKKCKNQAVKNVCTSGDPVNVVTGSFYIDATDLLIEDRGINLEIKRKYNSTDESIGPMGKGWTFEFESRIERRGDELTLVYPDGSVKEYEKKEGIWVNVSDDDESDKLTEVDSGQFTLKNKDKKTLKYDKNGKIISISDKNNNTLRVSYNHKGEIDTLITPGGKIITFISSSGKILQITDNTGRSVKYKYSGDNLAEATLPNGGTVRYSYEAGWITTVTDQNGVTYVKNEYDEKGRVTKQFDKNKNITEIIYNEDDKENVFIFHATNVVERYRYNERNLLSEKVYPDSTSEIYTYDICGNKDSVTDRFVRTTEYVYDKEGYLL
jgi:YD repeat-containing protein